ncbi:DUF401 family protein [Erysipelatoclostridium ramosum]|uniref:DUF401 family protein n=1 Tax=Thomasclavelia ramosa TaxID=1547 RepID=UPI0018AB4F76|nr:DUF401 family protein [Thomasclavelia ramosa]MDB7095776.1 DUF401 family protein [Thomasclavelia ramosa]HRM89593.1 DUF401 family protein [Thomasclavelia ramosa]
MLVVYLGIVFLIIVLLLMFRRPLYQSIIGGLIMMVILYKIPFNDIFIQITHVFTNWSSLQILISLYLITFLQKMLEKRQQIKLAQQDLNGLFHNRRINAGGAPLFIGLLPSAAAMILCGDIVKDATDGYLKPKDQAFVASWFRHIPESTLPTYAAVLLMANISGVPLSEFMIGMIIPVFALALIGYFSILVKIPSSTNTPKSQNRMKDFIHLFQHLWSLLMILVLILLFHLSIVSAVLIVIALCCMIYRFKINELLPLITKAFEKKMIVNTFLVLVFKEFIAYTGVLNVLPDLLLSLPIPPYLVFVILFFIGGIISGSSGIIALGTPIAFATIQGGMPLMVLLMCICHGASQLSPTHICLVVVADYFKVSLGDLIRKTIPKTLLFCLIAIIYYNLLILFL